MPSISQGCGFGLGGSLARAQGREKRRIRKRVKGRRKKGRACEFGGEFWAWARDRVGVGAMRLNYDANLTISIRNQALLELLQRLVSAFRQAY